MNIIGKVQIKNDVSAQEIAQMVETIASIVIFRRDDGSIAYMPYFFDNAVRVAVLSTIVEGIELDDDDEIINEGFDIKDEFIAPMIEKYIDEHDDLMVEVMAFANDVIDFRQKEYVANNPLLNEHLVKALAKENALNDMLLEIAKKQEKALIQEISANEKQEAIMSKMSEDDLLSLQKRLASGELDMTNMVSEVVEKYVNTDKSRDEKYKAIIDEKNKKITELSQYKAMYDARNVLTDDGK